MLKNFDETVRLQSEKREEWIKRDSVPLQKETSIPLQKDSGSQSRKQSHPSELFENRRKDDARWGERPGREGQIEELVGGWNPGPEAPPRSKKGQEKREQRRCQEKSNCQWSDLEG